MAFTGAYLTIIYAVLLHFTVIGTNAWIFSILNAGIKAILPIQGLVFILYPVIGLLADTKLTHYRMICLSCWILFVSNAAIISILSTSLLAGQQITFHVKYIPLIVVGFALFVLVMVGKGMFESTVIQFGTDQMIEASVIGYM